MRHYTMRRKGRCAFELLVISARCVVLQAQYVPNKRGLLKIVLAMQYRLSNAENAGSLAEKPRAAGRETLLVHTRAKEVVAR